MDFSRLAKRAGQLAVEHSPKILTAVGVVGTITTAYLAGKAAWNVAREIGNYEAGGAEVLTPLGVADYVRDEGLWKEFIPAVAVGCTTVTCIVMANHIGGRRAAAMAAAFTITERAAQEYSDKVVETIGRKKEEMIRSDIVKDRLAERYYDGIEIYGSERGELCYDKYSDRFFLSTIDEIKKAQVDFNYMLIHDGYASLNEFYSKLGLPAIGTGEIVGWNDAIKIELQITTTITPTDKPCFAIEFQDDPFPEYGRTFRRH